VDPLEVAELIRNLDDAGIRRAAVLSVAYQFGNPNRPPVENEYDQVKAENDWTSKQVARFPDRLRGLCGVNPLKDYALSELERCARDPFMRSDSTAFRQLAWIWTTRIAQQLPLRAAMIGMRLKSHEVIGHKATTLGRSKRKRF
jgi:hypothetical protein